jgi:hypothetical protein
MRIHADRGQTLSSQKFLFLHEIYFYVGTRISTFISLIWTIFFAPGSGPGSMQEGQINADPDPLLLGYMLVGSLFLPTQGLHLHN